MVVVDLAAAEALVHLFDAGRGGVAAEGHAIGVAQSEGEFIAVKIIAFGDLPAGDGAVGGGRIDADHEGLLGIEEFFLLSFQSQFIAERSKKAAQSAVGATAAGGRGRVDQLQFGGLGVRRETHADVGAPLGMGE